tara:strand:- start:374 stop:541 length:168 start_codon:yes stop_codon:yes gene_type:complete
MLLFKKTGEVALIVSKENDDWWMLLHSAAGIPNPSGFTTRELQSEQVEVLSSAAR